MMRAILTAEIVRTMGIVLLKPGRELMTLFSHGRILVESVPQNMASLAPGRIPDARQPLANDPEIAGFFIDERVIRAAGGISGLEYWLENRHRECQYPHSEYHHDELVTMRYPPGAIRVCWHCDNQLRDHTTDLLTRLAQENVIEWIIEKVLRDLGHSRERTLSIAELCWWALTHGVSEAITESLARKALRLANEPIPSVWRESDILPTELATSILKRHTDSYSPDPALQEPVLDAPITPLIVDPEPPASFFKKPKRIRWENQSYLAWVKSQPCECCRQPADDPHHLIGHGQGGMGTKAHDAFAIPLCRRHHNELHNDPVKFERKYGSQLEMLKNVLDRAFALGVLA